MRPDARDSATDARSMTSCRSRGRSSFVARQMSNDKRWHIKAWDTRRNLPPIDFRIWHWVDHQWRRNNSVNFCGFYRRDNGVSLVSGAAPRATISMTVFLESPRLRPIKR